MIVGHLNHRLPAETCRIVNEVQLRLCPTVECHIEPVVLLEAVCRFVFIIAERDVADGRTTFHLDKSDVGKGLVVMRMRFSRNDVENRRSYPPI